MHVVEACLLIAHARRWRIGEVLGEIHGKIEGILQLLNQAEHVGIEPGAQEHIGFNFAGAGMGLRLDENFFEIFERTDHRGNGEAMECVILRCLGHVFLPWLLRLQASISFGFCTKRW